MNTAQSHEKFCHSCGAQILKAAEMCPKCGVRQTSPGRPRLVSNEGAELPVRIASLCFPLLGLILYLVWQDSKPQASKDVGQWALAGLGIGFALYFFGMCTFFAL